MDIGFATALRNARLQVIIDALDAGAGTNATVQFFGGGAGRPATGAAITDQVLVGTLTLSNPSGTISNGVLTFDAISDDVSADADQDIEWARFYDTDGNFLIDMDCGIPLTQAEIDAGGIPAAIIFNTLTARIGGVIQILSGSLTEGNA